MSQAESPQFRLSEPQGAELVQYRAVSGMAVAGLVLGLLSVVALLTPVLWIVPVAGLALGAAALRQIARHGGALIGRTPAIAGMALSLVFLSAAPTEWYTYRHLVREESQQFARFWFDFLRHDEPHKAFQLTRHPNYRRALDDALWNAYPEGSELRRDLEAYVAKPEVRTLLALGEKAQVRYYDTEGQWWQNGCDVVYLVFAVTYEEDGRKNTFFVGLVLERFRLKNSGRADWRVVRSDGGIQPTALGGTLEAG